MGGLDSNAIQDKDSDLSRDIDEDARSSFEHTNKDRNSPNQYTLNQQ